MFPGRDDDGNFADPAALTQRENWDEQFHFTVHWQLRNQLAFVGFKPAAEIVEFERRRISP